MRIIEDMITGIYGNVLEEETQKMSELRGIIEETKELRIPHRIHIAPKETTRRLAYTLIEDKYRLEYINAIGYIKLEKEWVEPMSDYLRGKKCIEVMAGKGYLSANLRRMGVDIQATDIVGNERVECLCAKESIRKYKEAEIIIMSWVEYKNPIGYEVLKLKRAINPEAKIIMIGEGMGGCCGTDNLFELLEKVEDKEFKAVQERYSSWRAVWDTIQLIK